MARIYNQTNNLLHYYPFPSQLYITELTYISVFKNQKIKKIFEFTPSLQGSVDVLGVLYIYIYIYIYINKRRTSGSKKDVRALMKLFD